MWNVVAVWVDWSDEKEAISKSVESEELQPEL